METNHVADMKRKFVINRLGQPANRATFDCEGRQVTVQQYMRDKYNFNLR